MDPYRADEEATVKLYGGIDLQSDISVLVLIEEQDRVV